MRQRFRWSFGILQAVWKHRLAFVRNRPWVISPCPTSSSSKCSCRCSRPLSTSCSSPASSTTSLTVTSTRSRLRRNFEKLVFYFLGFLVIDFITSAVAFSLERRHPLTGRWLAPLPHLAAALRLPPALLHRPAQNSQARHRRQTLQLGKTRAHRKMSKRTTPSPTRIRTYP